MQLQHLGYRSMFSFAAVMLTGTLACSQQTDDPVLKALAREQLKNVGDIDIRGVVLSESGRPLADVNVRYVFREYGDVVAQIPDEVHTISVDGDFRIKRNDISSVSLSASKSGYYGETWQYNFSADNPRRYPDGHEIIELEIVLKKRPTPAPLEKIEGLLRTGVNGPNTTLGIWNPPITHAAQTDDEIKEWKLVEAGPPVLYLEAVAEGAGGFAIVEFRPRGQSYTANGLARGRLMHSGGTDGDGFVVFDPGEIPLRRKIVFRDMNMAPLDGYSPSIKLTSASGPEVVYFYFRIAGLYGKGMVSGRPVVVGEGDAQEAVASTTIFLNPTGSRDVAFLHH